MEWYISFVFAMGSEHTVFVAYRSTRFVICVSGVFGYVAMERVAFKRFLAR